MRSKKYIIGISVSIIFLIAGCSKVPKGILSEKEMQRVHEDMLLADAMIAINYSEFSNDTTRMALYESVFRKHKTTQAVYDSSLVWYGKNLDIYMKVYDRIQANLTERIRELGDVQADAAPSSNRDSVDIWPRRPYLALQPNAVFNGVTFDIKPDRNYPSGSTFVLGYRIWGLKEGMNNYPRIQINAEQRDSTIRREEVVTTDGYHEIVLETQPTRQVRRIYGYIFMDNNEADYHKIYVDSLSLMRYNYGRNLRNENTDESPSSTN